MLLPHRELAVGMVLRATGDPAEAEDCVHDAMLRLVRRDDLDPARVRSLLIRAALHIAIDHHRAAGRRQSAVLRLGGGAAAEVTSPEQVLADRADAGRVLAAVDRLPPRERQVMLLRLAGLNVAETARRLGISVKSVEGAYTRARARVRLFLAGVLAWVLDRLRRHSPHGELAAATTVAAFAAAATTVAALFVLDHSWITGDALPPRPAPPALGRAQAFPAPLAAEPPTARLARPGTAPPPAAGGGSQGQHTNIDLGLFPKQGPGFKKHNPPPDCQVCLPIDAPFGLASTGVYVSGVETNPQDNVDAWMSCIDNVHTGDVVNDPC